MAEQSWNESAYSGRERVAILVSCILGFALDLYDILILPFLMPSIQASLGMSLTQAASLTSLTLIGSVIGGAVFGWVGDRLGRKSSLQLSLALIAAGSIASAFAWDYGSLAVLRFITGIGLGGEWGAGMVLFNEAWNPRRRGVGSAVIQGGSVLAASGASVVGIWAVTGFAPDMGWRVGLLTGGAPILLLIFVRIWMPESRAWVAFDQGRRTDAAPAALARTNPLLGMFAPELRRTTVVALSWLTAFMFCYYGVVVFIPTLLLKTLHTPPEIVRNAAVVVSMVSGVTYVTFGLLNDRLGRRVGAVGPNSMWVVALVGIGLWGSVQYQGDLLAWPLFWIYVAFGMGNAALGVAGVWLSELYPIAVRATAVSSLYMAARALGSLGPIVVPMVAAATGSLQSGMLVCLPAALLFIALSFVLPETRKRVTAPNPSAEAH